MTRGKILVAAGIAALLMAGPASAQSGGNTGGATTGSDIVSGPAQGGSTAGTDLPNTEANPAAEENIAALPAIPAPNQARTRVLDR